MTPDTRTLDQAPQPENQPGKRALGIAGCKLEFQGRQKAGRETIGL